MISIDHLATSLRCKFMGCVCSWQAASYHSSCCQLWSRGSPPLEACSLARQWREPETCRRGTTYFIGFTIQTYDVPLNNLYSIIQHQHPILLTFLSFNVDSNINESTNPPQKHRYFSVFIDLHHQYNPLQTPNGFRQLSFQAEAKCSENYSISPHLGRCWVIGETFKQTNCMFWLYPLIYLLYTHIISYLMLHDHVMVYEGQCWQCLVINYNLTPIADMHLQKTHVNWIE